MALPELAAVLPDTAETFRQAVAELQQDAFGSAHPALPARV